MGIKQPPGFQHPRKRNRQVEALAAKTADGTNFPTREQEGRQKEPKLTGKSNSIEMNGQKAVLRLVVSAPARGQISRYDEMISSGVTPKDALLGLLRRSDEHLSRLSTMSAKKLATLTYESTGPTVETNRSISAKLYAQLRSAFDPFDVMTQRGLGLKIGAAVIRLVAEGKSDE